MVNVSRNDSRNAAIDECLVGLLTSSPMKSYFRLSFRQMMGFILSRSSTAYLLDLPYLQSYVSELRASFNTLCSEDRQTLRPPAASRHTTSGGGGDTFLRDASEDASFLTYWAIIEASKYCICHKFAPEMPANDYLNLLRKEILSPVALGDKVTRRFLANFIQTLDKFLQDRTGNSSTEKHTFVGPNNIEQFYKLNCSIFQSWWLKNRQDISKLSLAIDDPAECWRNVSLKLQLDLAAKFQDFTSAGIRDQASLSQTIMSLDARHWHFNLSLIAMSAKQLGDLPLLYGIQALTELRGVISDYQPLGAIMSNLEGSYQRTYDMLEDSKDLEEQSVIELLDSCIELDILESNIEYIDKLKSDAIKIMYKKYLESKRRQHNSGETTIPGSRIEEIERWLSTWSEMNESNTTIQVQPIKFHLDLIVPTCLNVISNAPQEEHPTLIERSEMLMAQDVVAQCLFRPNSINGNINVYQVLFEIFKGTPVIDDNLVKKHSDDLHWNQLLYRHLCDLKMIDKLRVENPVNIDLIQLRAAKFHMRHDNTTRAIQIVENLVDNTRSTETKVLSSLLLAEGCHSSRESTDTQTRFHQLQTIAQRIGTSQDLANPLRGDLISKVLRHVLRLPTVNDYGYETTKLESILEAVSGSADLNSGTSETTESPEKTLAKWQKLLDSSSLISKIRTMLLLSKSSNHRLRVSSANDDLLNSTFDLDLKLLHLLCQSRSTKHKSSALQCAIRLIELIVANDSRLNCENLNRFKSPDFIDGTISVWVATKNNLISLVTYKDDLAEEWRNALIVALCRVAQAYPNLLVYSIIVNRLDLQNDLVMLEDAECSLTTQEHLTTLMLQDNSPTTAGGCQQQQEEPKNKRLNVCRQKLAFWNQLLDHIKSSTQFENRWSNVVAETERFLKEIRKISFLCGEYFKTVTVRIPKRLFSFLDSFEQSCDDVSGLLPSKQRQEEYEKRLKNICEQALKPIRILISYDQRIGASHMTLYDKWFCGTFGKHLRELEYRLNLLASKKPLVLHDLEKLIRSITELLAICRSTLFEYNHNNRQKIYMELISPMLSRLEPSLIPMPDCYSEISNPRGPMVTIHKISQTVDLIVSKTCPKKLKFIGSDGVARSFLLKAHEDLRLDQFVMDTFASINSLLLGNKTTQNKHRIRRYSVTPVSSRSGLIEWIEAPSLCSAFRAWVDSSNGKKIIEELYSTSCEVLCEGYHHLPTTHATAHSRCQTPHSVQPVDLYYQLLWTKTRPSKRPITQSKPFSGNTIKYRAEFDSSVFESVVEQLVDLTPSELVANHLWYKSINSQAYWLKTREFIHSCATMSIVGYLIGLGDRHPENILLDYSTGEVIHIDYNICFDMGRNLTIPERVPFRLTQNIIHAFGFAGLEGGFTLSCRDVLNALKEYNSTLLHLLEPVNLSFMIGEPSRHTLEESTSKGGAGGSRAANLLAQVALSDEPKIQTIPVQINTGMVRGSTVPAVPAEMDMCSQEESVELRPATGTNDVSDLLILNHHSIGRHKQQTQARHHDDQLEIKPLKAAQMCGLGSFDLQHNIKTPTKIATKMALTMHQHIGDKLSGTDEFVRRHTYKQDCGEERQHVKQSAELEENSQEQGAIDLILLNDAQTTEDQVHSLIVEATSIKNMAAMFQGWMPWI